MLRTIKQKINNRELLKAIRNNNQIEVKKYLDKGADINAKNDLGETPLILACGYNNKDIVQQLLLQSGIDINAQAISAKCYGTGFTALMLATQVAHKDIVQLLLEAGADPNCKDNGGVTALMLAARGAHKDIVQLLLEAGADPNCKDTCYGWTALIWCIDCPFINKIFDVRNSTEAKEHRKKIIECLKLLLQYGADSNIVGKDLSTMLNTAHAYSYVYPEFEQEVSQLLEDQAQNEKKVKSYQDLLDEPYNDTTSVLQPNSLFYYPSNPSNDCSFSKENLKEERKPSTP